MKVGLFFGSFNPIHVGHLIIANFMATQTELEQVWLVVSPQNPFKAKSSLARDYERLHLVQLAIDDNPKLRVSNIEFSLPKPSYTIDTLTYLKEKYPQHAFSLIMGGDNLGSFHKWKNYEQILAHHQIFVYKRPQYHLGDLV
ncbi:MAG: nicotinate (nicotinamide) nucleotide adenylyltransferase, partial [Bacteroidota bacterium]